MPDKVVPTPIDAKAIQVVERRSNDRLKVYLNAHWEGIMGRHPGTISDISIGGCFILTGTAVALQELIRVEIQLPTDEWITAWGEVANHTPEIGFGIRYTEFEADAHATYVRALGCVEEIQAAVAALRRLDSAAVKREFDAPVRILTTPEDYKKILEQLVFPVVNQALVKLPECRKKSDIRLAMGAYVDACRAWDAMLREGVAGHKGRIEMYRRLREKYEAPPDILHSLIHKEPPAVLDFLWRKGCIYLALAS